MIATVPGWPARPVLSRAVRWKGRVRLGAGLLGQALEIVGLIAFVAVLGAMPVIVAAFSG